MAREGLLMVLGLLNTIDGNVFSIGIRQVKLLIRVLRAGSEGKVGIIQFVGVIFNTAGEFD